MHCESKESHPRTQHKAPGQGANLHCLNLQVQRTNHDAAAAPNWGEGVQYGTSFFQGGQHSFLKQNAHCSLWIQNTIKWYQ